MGPALLSLLGVAVLFGLGFAVPLVWVVAIVSLAAWVLGFVVHAGGSTWFRW